MKSRRSILGWLGFGAVAPMVPLAVPPLSQSESPIVVAWRSALDAGVFVSYPGFMGGDKMLIGNRDNQG